MNTSFPNAVVRDKDQLIRELDDVGSCLCEAALSAEACDDLRRQAEILFRSEDLAEERVSRALSKGTVHFSNLARFKLGGDFVFSVFNYFRNSMAIEVLQGSFGKSIAFPLKFCTLRFHEIRDAERSFQTSRLPLHQDNFPRDPNIMMVNSWIALDDCGRSAPGLELFRSPTKEYYSGVGLTDEDLANSNIPRHEVGYQSMVDMFGEDCVARPVFRAGDAALFNRFTLHRTNVQPEMTKSRFSIELRGCSAKYLFASYNFFADCQDCIVVSKSKKGSVIHRSAVLAYDTKDGPREKGGIAIA